jgi:SIR2-like domain
VSVPDDSHFGNVADEILDGYVIPFLGAGANLLERPEDASWKLGTYLPSATELAAVLASKSRYPDEPGDLLRVSQYVDAILGTRVLYRHLHALFNADYPPNSLHRLLAKLPRMLRERGTRHQLIMTTNYDDALERAFSEQGESYDVVWYEAKPGKESGKFIHCPPGGGAVSINVPNEYEALSLEERTVILKLHGAVNREDKERDSYVITEDNYIDYLSRGDFAGQIPMILREVMAESHFLFLGYSMRDWNLRVILNRIWDQAELNVQSWAIQLPHPKRIQNDIELKLWADRAKRSAGDIDLHQLPLKTYVDRLDEQLLDQARVTV